MALANEPEEAEAEDWLTTYADAITLLMAFFVMLVSFSKIDIPLYEKVAAGIKNEIGKDSSKSPTELLKINIQDAVYNMQADEAVKVENDDKGIVIELASSAFYKPGSADIREEAFPVLQQMFEMLNNRKYRTYVVEVEGHTDDDPIHTVRFPSNWELSAGRATRVVRFFIEEGMDIERLKAVGYGDTRPKVPNRDADGKAIKENQSENRRVNLRVYPMDIDDHQKMQKKIKLLDLNQDVEQEMKDAQKQQEQEQQQRQQQQQPGQVIQQAPTPIQNLPPPRPQ